MAKFLDYGEAGYLEWQGQLNEEINFRPFFMRKTPQEQGFRTILAVKTKISLGFLSSKGKLLMPYSNGFQGGSGGQTQQKTLVLEEFKAEVAYSKQDYKDLIWYEMANQGGVAQNSIEGTSVIDAERRIFFEQVKDDAIRNFWLGDKDKTHIAAGTYPDGTTHAAGDADLFYNQIDGLLKKLREDSAATPNEKEIQRIQIPNTLSPDDAIAIMKEVYRKSRRVLRQAKRTGQLRFYVSDEFYFNYVDSLTNDGTEAAHMKTIEGLGDVLTFNGIPLVPIEMDEFIAEDFAGSAAKHYCILSVPSNFVQVLNARSDFSETRFWFNPDENENRQRTQFEMGAEYLEPKWVTIGYNF